MRHQQKMLRNKRLRLFALLLMSAWGLSLKAEVALGAPEPSAQGQQVVAPSGKPPKKALDEILQTPFAYRRENRSDPFTPFITKETGPTQFAPEENAPLTGMQLFEPGQLTLVAILFSGGQGIAMVEDSTGMGHVIKVKDKIGRRGEIKAILPNAVIIEEWSLTTSGTRRLTTREMVLRKEGDKE